MSEIAGGTTVQGDSTENREVHIHLPAIYNVYNAAAAVCAYRTFADNYLPQDQIFEALSDVTSSFGRMENFDLDGVPIQMILVKNPAGCNQSIRYMTSLGEDYTLVLCLNDRTADGHDISWIWDADYELFAEDSHLQSILVCGDRAGDMQLRLKYAGIGESRITRMDRYEAVVEALRGSERPAFAMPNYTSMLALREVLSKATGKSEFWK